jgi:hypothetical protein
LLSTISKAIEKKKEAGRGSREREMGQLLY